MGPVGLSVLPQGSLVDYLRSRGRSVLGGQNSSMHLFQALLARAWHTVRAIKGHWGVMGGSQALASDRQEFEFLLRHLLAVQPWVKSLQTSLIRCFSMRTEGEGDDRG